MTTVHTVKSKWKISQNFVAFSEYMNFTYNILLIDFEGIIILRTKKFRKNIIFIKKQNPLCSFSSRCVNTKNSDKTGQTTLNFFALELATVV